MAFFGLLAPSEAARAGDDGVTDLKVAYLYNFTRFVDWPADSDARAFVIGVVGDPDMADSLGVLERDDRRAEGRPIRIRTYQPGDRFDDCHLLFVGGSAARYLDDIAARLAAQPVLIVGDSRGDVGRGAAIEFFLKPDIFGQKAKLRFRIDPTSLEGRGLVVSAQLLDVAEVVR